MTASVWPTGAGTGHRPRSTDPVYTLRQKALLPGQLDRLVCRLRDERGMTVGISGMAIGFDTLWAHAILNAGLALWAFIPGTWQGLKWSDAQQRERAALLQRATRVRNFDRLGHYNVAALHERNEAMFDEADVGVTNWLRWKHDGGTHGALKYAIDKRRLPMIWVDVTRDAKHVPAEGEEWNLAFLPSEKRWRELLKLKPLQDGLFALDAAPRASRIPS